MKFDMRKALSGLVLFSGYFVAAHCDSSYVEIPAAVEPKKLISDYSDTATDPNQTQTDQTAPPQRAPSDRLPQTEVTPNAQIRVNHPWNFYLTVDFIYWNAREDGLGFATTGVTPSTGPALVTSPIAVQTRGKVQHPDFDWKPGFKIGLGIDLMHDGWELYTNYTRLRSRTDKFKTSANSPTDPSNTVFFFGLDFESPSNNGILISGLGNWKLAQFNVVDSELARDFFVGKRLTLRPAFGIKGSWQTQKYSVHYNSLFRGLPTESRIDQSMNYWGVGLRSGISSGWLFDQWWSIYGSFNVSTLWGQFETKRRDKIITAVVDAPLFRTKNEFHTLTPVLEIAMGIKWEDWFQDEDYHVAISAGWEQQVWFSMNQLISFVEESNHGNLVLQGLDVKFRFDF